MPANLHECAHSPSCRSVKVLARIAGIELNLVHVNMMEGEHNTPEYLEINPFHQVPSLTDGDLKLFESRAILTYLLNKYAPDSDLYPKDPAKRAMVDAVLIMDAGSIASLYGARARSLIMTGKDLSEVAIKAGKDTLGGLDRLLSRHKYAAGDKMTVADINLVHTLGLVEIVADDINEFSNVKNYYKKMKDELGDVYHEINEIQHEKLKALVDSKRSA